MAFIDYFANAMQDTNTRPGTPVHKIIDVNKSHDQQIEWARAHPIEARDWDAQADRRRAAWEASPFAAALDRLLRKHYNAYTAGSVEP